MKSIYLTIWFGIKETLTHRNYLILLFLTFFVMFILFTLIPVWSVPGNTIATQLDILPLQGYIALLLLSGLYALFIAMQVYVMRQRKSLEGVGSAVGGGAGALVAGVAGTAFCASCLAPLFALFGIGCGGVLFVLQYSLYFVIGIIVLMLIAIYFTARKIQGVCDSC